MFTAAKLRIRNKIVSPQCLALRQFGNFELYHPIPPRYFLVKYELNTVQFREKVLD